MKNLLYSLVAILKQKESGTFYTDQKKKPDKMQFCSLNSMNRRLHRLEPRNENGLSMRTQVYR